VAKAANAAKTAKAAKAANAAKTAKAAKAAKTANRMISNDSRHLQILCLSIFFFFCSIILAFSLTKTMAAHYFIRFLSAVPKAHWQQPNTP